MIPRSAKNYSSQKLAFGNNRKSSAGVPQIKLFRENEKSSATKTAS